MTTAPDRRLDRRVPATIKIIYVHDGDYLISYSKDLSVNGMFVYSKKPLNVGEETSVSFSIGRMEQVTVTARVMWVNRSEMETEAGMGLCFVDPPDDFKAAVLDAVNRVAFLPELEP